MNDDLEWAAYDEESHSRRLAAVQEQGPLRCVFYGRVSTADMQDPETSRLWQLESASRVVDMLGGVLVGEFFDVGLTRAMTWNLRDEAGRLLGLLREARDPQRLFDVVVVGELQRCFYGTQFDDVFPELKTYDVGLAALEFSGLYDSENTSHRTIKTMGGFMSETEREVTRTRVRLGMRVQVRDQGRLQGGRPPFGYATEPYAMHPNSRKSAEGHRLKRLVIDPEAAGVVQRIYEQYLSGDSMRQIAAMLNRQGVPTPSQWAPEQNLHRTKSAWQVGTLKVILANPRYTGYEFWGRTRKTEVPVDLRDRSRGFKVRMVPADEAPVRSVKQSHEAIISVAAWRKVQDIQQTRTLRSSRYRDGVHPMTGRVTCGLCGRRMEVERYNKHNDNQDRPTFVRFRCRGLRHGPGTTPVHHRISFLAKHLTAAIDSWLADALTGEGGGDLLLRMLTLTDAGGRNAAELAKVEAQVRYAEASLDRLVQLTLDGVSQDAVRRKMRDIDVEIQALKARRDGLRRVPTQRATSDLEARIGALLAQGGIAAAAPYDLLRDFYEAVDLCVVCLLDPKPEASVKVALRVVTPDGPRFGEHGVRPVGDEPISPGLYPTAKETSAQPFEADPLSTSDPELGFEAL